MSSYKCSDIQTIEQGKIGLTDCKQNVVALGHLPSLDLSTKARKRQIQSGFTLDLPFR